MTADYRAFLAPRAPVVLPYFGGTRIDAPDRRWRVDAQDLVPGWWRWRLGGRRAEPIEVATAPDLDALPRVRGHWACGAVVADAEGHAIAAIALPPDDEPAPLARVTARRWYSGEHLLGSVDFEDDAEQAAREALAECQPLGQVRGTTPSLRIAYGIALGERLGRARGEVMSARELAPHALAIAETGMPAMDALIAARAARREAVVDVAARSEHARRASDAVGAGREVPRAADAIQRADDALDHAAARMLGVRTLERGTELDVTYDVDGVRVTSRVDARTLQVLDPGVCLSGAHRVLTLDAMPSVIREAIEEGALHLTRRA